MRLTLYRNTAAFCLDSYSNNTQYNYEKVLTVLFKWGLKKGKLMISFKNIYKEYNEVLFENFSMDIEEGIITALIAPSGSGKTTLMNMLMGFAEPDSGKIEGIVNKSISAVFQEDRLLESFSVRENMAVCGCAEKELDYVASLLDIKDCLNMYPNELSGGMRLQNCHR